MYLAMLWIRIYLADPNVFRVVQFLREEKCNFLQVLESRQNPATSFQNYGAESCFKSGFVTLVSKYE